MVQFVFAVRSIGMFHQRSTNAVCWSCHGNRSRWSLLRGCLSLVDPTSPFLAQPAGRLYACLLVVFFAAVSAGQEPAGTASISAPTVQSYAVSESQAQASIQWLASLALSKTPRTFDGDKDWGQTKQVWSGLNVHREGLKLKTNRRFREQEHGRWIKYEVTLPDTVSAAGSDPHALTCLVHEATSISDQATGQQRLRVRATFTTPLQYQARVQRWNVGVKLFSATVTGHMKVRLETVATMGFSADYSELPPALVIDPLIESAKQWGRVIEDVLVERIVEKQNTKLVDKMNRSIEKERDDLRVSMKDWLNHNLSTTKN
jgi:hypothetical protein